MIYFRANNFSMKKVPEKFKNNKQTFV